jgi:hypothetical protein
LVRGVLRLYPRAWRERYADEVALVLAAHRVTYWTALDVLLGALDAHLHPDLLPGRLTSMAYRMRNSEITTFAAFVLFCLAWLPLGLALDPLPSWQMEAAGHPALLVALDVLGAAYLVAALAVLVGGVPLLFSTLAQSIAARRWRQLALVAIPILAATALVAVWLADLPWSSVSRLATLTPLQSLALQIGLILLPLVAIGGSALALGVAVGRSELSQKALRFAMLPASIVTAALAVGLAAAVAVTALFITAPPILAVAIVPASSPQLAAAGETLTHINLVPLTQSGAWVPLQVGGLLVMLVAVVLAGTALRRGLQAVRGRAGAA